MSQDSTGAAHPRYTLLIAPILRIVPAFLLGRGRSFHRDALALLRGITPPIKIIGSENIPQKGPCLLTVNHYYRPGFDAWWLAICLSAVVPVEIQWVITTELTYPGQRRGIILGPLVRLLLRGITRVYGFIRMPPMPPRPQDAVERGLAVRQAINAICQAERPLIGLAPEGQDIYSGTLGMPPPGAGRFIQHLNRLGLPILPVGVFEEDGIFHLSFGAPCQLEIPPGLSSQEQDVFVRRTIMKAIARQLPKRLRGEFDNLPGSEF